MFLSLTQPFDSRDILDGRHSAGAFCEKIQRLTSKVFFNGRSSGWLRAMKTEIWVVLDVPDDFDEKIRINHVNHVKIYHAKDFMSFLKFVNQNNG
jgi:hypothetical protein